MIERNRPMSLVITQNKQGEWVFCGVGVYSCEEPTKKTPVAQLESNKSVNSNRYQTLEPTMTASEEIETNSHFGNLMMPKNATKVGSIHFDFNEFQSFSTENIANLLKIIPKIADRSVLLVGFTDNIGSKDVNEVIAYRRAENVKSFLVQAGMPASNFKLAGEGLCCYAVPNGTAEQRKLNRRVEIYAYD